MHPLTPIKTVVFNVCDFNNVPPSLYHVLKYKRFQIIMLPKNPLIFFKSGFLTVEYLLIEQILV